MKKLNLFLLIIIFSKFSLEVNSQTIERLYQKRDSLLEIKISLEKELSILTDSINLIKHKIILYKIDSLKTNSFVAFTSEVMTSSLRDKASVLGNIILKIPKNEQVKIVDYKDSYFKVIYQDKIGYLNEVYLQTSDVIKLFTKTKEVEKESNISNSLNQKKTTPYKPKSARTYFRGPRGGCYYINSSGNKQYVDRSLCN